MSDSLEVDLDELRTHANGLSGVHDRFATIREASSHIVKDDEAYGQLCQVFPGILEDRHLQFDEVVDILAENIELLAEAVDGCAAMYEEADTASADEFAALESDL